VRHKFQAESVYLALTGLYTFTFSLVLTVALVYQTQEAGLNPFQLVITGTATQVGVLLFEIPTGVLADLRGRRLSVITGIGAMGLAYTLMGASTSFWTILAAQSILGVGLTFVSGAQEAWIADEVGVENAGRVYLRSAQTMQYGRLAGIPAGVGLGLISLSIPILFGGFMFAATGLLMFFIMPETGFRRSEAAEGSVRIGFARTLKEGARVVRTKSILVTLFAMVAFYETAGEVFNRLNVAHFIEDIGFPAIGHFEPVVWFGIMRMASAVVGIALLQYVRHRADTSSHEVLSRWLMRINLLQLASLLAFAFTTEFWTGMLVSLSATNLSRAFQPLYIALINLHVDSSVRATVISMSSQVDSLGQVLGAPLLGVVGSLVSVRAALVGTSLMLGPAVALNFLAIGQYRRTQLAGGQPAE